LGFSFNLHHSFALLFAVKVSMATPGYGGDEISAIVLDPGAYTTRIGYAGEDTPKANLPTFCGYYTGRQQKFKHGYYLVGDTEINTLHPGMDITNPFQDGLILDWEANISLWKHAFEERLRTNTAEHPLLVTEPAWNTPSNREKTLETCFETFNVPAFYMAKQPVLASYAIGKHTALVVDLGAQMASVVPVSEGLVLKKGLLLLSH
jgi:actin-related protein 4